jgi:hypothetical protein
MKKILLIVLLVTTISVNAKQLILIDFDVATGTEFLVDKDSIRQIDNNNIFVEMQFNMNNPSMKFFTQRLFNCKNRESSILKISLNEGPLGQPRGSSGAAFVPNDGKSFSKVFNYVCNFSR